MRYLTVRIGTRHVVGLKETAVGLRALAYMSNFDSNDTIEVCRNVFVNADHFGEYPAAARFEVYKLIDVFIDIHRASLKKMEGEFIKGILSMAELEKDPRCLMLFFSTVLVILSEWKLNGYVNDLWEAVSRYFPITFRAKPDDPIGITADDLKIRLRMCIAGTSEFAPLAFPYLIEKLDYQVTANVKVSGNSICVFWIEWLTLRRGMLFKLWLPVSKLMACNSLQYGAPNCGML